MKPGGMACRAETGPRSMGLGSFGGEWQERRGDGASTQGEKKKKKKKRASETSRASLSSSVRPVFDKRFHILPSSALYVTTNFITVLVIFLFLLVAYRTEHLSFIRYGCIPLLFVAFMCLDMCDPTALNPIVLDQQVSYKFTPFRISPTAGRLFYAKFSRRHR